MEFSKPAWCLEVSRCDCCDGQGALCFSTCPECGYIVLVCDEVGTVFPNPKDLTHEIYGAVDESSFLCPNCEKVAVADFRHSTSDEVQRLGFVAGEYE